VRAPLHLLTDLDGEAALAAPRLLVVAGAGSSVTVIDEYAGGGAPSQVHATVEVLVEDNAQVRAVTIQRLGKGVVLHVSQRARVGRDAKLVSVWASLGASYAKADLGTLLAGKGAEVELLGFLFGTGRQHFDHHTVHEHRAPHTHSDLDFKVVLKDRARSAYTGLIRIAPEAPVSEAYQENRNLLLNDGAKADSIPELEILTDEVMCTHGATIGSLDPEQLFYLQSRGIPKREAARMIVEGFFEPTLARLPEDVRERIREHVEAGLAAL
jgi:Fe-S cluster assembly protein SufD